MVRGRVGFCRVEILVENDVVLAGRGLVDDVVLASRGLVDDVLVDKAPMYAILLSFRNLVVS